MTAAAAYFLQSTRNANLSLPAPRPRAAVTAKDPVFFELTKQENDAIFKIVF